ncbi:MAG: hypothetical protein LUH05_09055 [Candidatus Gastranaerophilales bacterium]|nr:hypothetical protein [Candidatus Gastranaerophilales bacterium]
MLDLIDMVNELVPYAMSIVDTYTYDVDPANFVFNSTQSDNFDTTPKIYRTWKTPDYIINNKYFEVSKEAAEELKSLVKTGSDESVLSNQEAQNLRYEYVNGTNRSYITCSRRLSFG